MTNWRFPLLLCVAILSLSGIGCGGDKDSTPNPTAPSVPEPPSPPVVSEYELGDRWEATRSTELEEGSGECRGLGTLVDEDRAEVIEAR
ncbi:MAG: hypothetical protein KDA27_23295 [Candidatus Eisenbacteria bacterium]|uniref:Secreted protein n=1 Tax=Eiseniibacteriota bacterium TaxID=2212470 RepID=A0A956SHR9_UNCEI|nr:hypothetical protein [Candidatus Eisenbacteria bacterium]MCB9465869.1 hypothetical protein [Candidatus Eisenbacteria bacterium]